MGDLQRPNLAKRMKALVSFGTPPREEIQRAVAGLRHEIALAYDKRRGIDAAIKAREQRLARLEAQLVLTSPAQSAVVMIVR